MNNNKATLDWRVHYEEGKAFEYRKSGNRFLLEIHSEDLDKSHFQEGLQQIFGLNVPIYKRLHAQTRYLCAVQKTHIKTIEKRSFMWTTTFDVEVPYKTVLVVVDSLKDVPPDTAHVLRVESYEIELTPIKSTMEKLKDIEALSIKLSALIEDYTSHATLRNTTKEPA